LDRGMLDFVKEDLKIFSEGNWKTIPVWSF
jgi:hypothetical protein